MRHVKTTIAALALAASGAQAAPLDCAALKTTAMPFQLTIARHAASYRDSKGRPVAVPARSMRQQVFRGAGGETTAFMIETPETYARVRYRNWKSVQLTARPANVEFASVYDIDIATDQLLAKKSFDYVKTVTGSDSSQTTETNHAVFVREEDMNLGGCSFHLLVYDISIRISPHAQGGNVARALRLHYSPELGVPLRAFVPAKLVEGEMFNADQVATGIETVFVRKED